MQTEYVRPFIDGVQELVSTMLQGSCHVTDSTQVVSTDISSIISLDGETSGRVALSFPRETAARMVAQLLDMDQAEVDDEILGDGVGELANIVAGVAKGRLSSTAGRTKLSLPSVVFADDHRLDPFRAAEVVHLRMLTNYGEFSLRVWFVTRSDAAVLDGHDAIPRSHGAPDRTQESESD